jgi:hypothetical protein
LRSRILAEEETVEDVEDASHQEEETTEPAAVSNGGEAKMQPIEPEIQTIDEEELDKEKDEVHENDEKDFDEDGEEEEEEEDEDDVEDDDDIASIQSGDHDKVPVNKDLYTLFRSGSVKSPLHVRHQTGI